MITLIKTLIAYLIGKPNVLFLIDGIGAALTSCALYFVLGKNFPLFGMPVNVLTYLSLVGLIYCAYSFTCYFFLRSYWTFFLRLIAILNILYCLVTFTLVIKFFSDLTQLGLIYFIWETFNIVLLVFLELKVANKIKSLRTK